MSPAKVLVVADAPELVAAIQCHLALARIGSGIARSAEQAIAMTRSEFFPVIIADIDMAGLSGVELVDTLKKINPFAQIVLLATESSLAQVVDCIGRGALDYFARSDGPTRLIEVVSYALVRGNRWKELLDRVRRPAAAR